MIPLAAAASVSEFLLLYFTLVLQYRLLLLCQYFFLTVTPAVQDAHSLVAGVTNYLILFKIYLKKRHRSSSFGGKACAALERLLKSKSFISAANEIPVRHYTSLCSIQLASMQTLLTACKSQLKYGRLQDICLCEPGCSFSVYDT